MNMQTLKQEIKEKFKKMNEQQFDNFMEELRVMYNKTHNKSCDEFIMMSSIIGKMNFKMGR